VKVAKAAAKAAASKNEEVAKPAVGSQKRKRSSMKPHYSECKRDKAFVCRGGVISQKTKSFTIGKTPAEKKAAEKAAKDWVEKELKEWAKKN